MEKEPGNEVGHSFPSVFFGSGNQYFVHLLSHENGHKLCLFGWLLGHLARRSRPCINQFFYVRDCAIIVRRGGGGEK